MSGPDTSPTKVVIDTDAGVDDAIALFLALAAHKDPKKPFTVVGITTVVGNTSLENVKKNVLKVLDCAGVDDVPVYLGAATPLLKGELCYEPTFHGVDGLGDVPPKSMSAIFSAKEDRKLEEEFAPLALARLAREYKNELTVVALGPLTNLALAIKMDPDFERNVKEVYIMGGNIYAVGNMKPCAEFNFLVDPESAHIVLSACWNKNIVIIPWETCLKALPSLEWRMEVLGQLNTKPIQLMNLMELGVMKNYQQFYGKGRWISPDCVCMIALLRPDIVSAKSTFFCTVELHGSHTRGQMVVDHPNRSGNPHNATIVESLDTPELEKMFLEYFKKM